MRIAWKDEILVLYHLIDAIYQKTYVFTDFTKTGAQGNVLVVYIFLVASDEIVQLAERDLLSKVILKSIHHTYIQKVVVCCFDDIFQ